MKNLLLFTVSLFLLTSCSKYTSLTKENYEILNRDNNLSKVKARFSRQIDLEMVTSDTIISSVDSKGVAKFNHITRKINSIPPYQKVKITESTNNTFMIEFIDYKLSFTSTKGRNGDFVIKTNKYNVIDGTNYVISDNSLNVVFKLKDKRSTKKTSLKK